MGDVVDLNPRFQFDETPSEVARAQRRLASQFRESQESQGQSEDRVIERRTVSRELRDQVDIRGTLQRNDDRTDIANARARQEDIRAQIVAEETRRSDDQRALDRIALSRQFNDQQRTAAQIQQVEARVQDQRELDRRRAAQLVIDQRLTDQRIATAQFNAQADRGSIVDLTA